MAALALASAPACSPAAGKGTRPVVDGRVTPGEYAFNVSFEGGFFELHWTMLGDRIQLAISARTTGWLALGLEPTKMMQNADMIIGWWNSTTDFQIVDAYSTGLTGPHPPDTQLGGTYDILSYLATQDNGTTTLELTRMLDTKDPFDHVILANRDMHIIWSTSDSKEFDQKHSHKGLGVVNFATGKAKPVSAPRLWPYHATLMVTGAVLFVAIYFMHDLKRKDRALWTKLHHVTIAAAASSSIAGLTLGLYMVGLLGQGHLRVLHAFVGATTLTIVITSLALGLVFHFVKPLKRRTRMPHMAMGASTIVMMVVTVITGLMYVFPQ